MVKNQFVRNTMIIFLCLFSFMQCQVTWIDYDFSTMTVERKMTDPGKTHSYALDFKGGQLPYYVKVEVTSDDTNPAPLVCFSNKGQACTEREQLVKNAVGKTALMWLKREQFEKDDQELYVYVECPVSNCQYTIKFTGDQTASFPPNFVYSYLVTAANREMRFEINGEEKNAYMTVALQGSAKATLNLDGIYNEGVIHKTGRALTFFLEDYENSSKITTINVKGAEVGDYITLSSHIVNTTVQYEGVTKEGILVPNGPEVLGYLEYQILNEECFPIDFSKNYKDMDTVYVTAKVFTKYAWFFLEDENKVYHEDTEILIDGGHLAFPLKNNGKLNYVCLELIVEDLFEQHQMAFSISLSQPNGLPQLYDYYPPQITGEIYRRMIPRNTIAFFSGVSNDSSAKKYDYSLLQRKGLSKMYIAECKTYPNCHYTESQLSNLIEPKPVNQMTIWTTNEDKSSTLNPEKYVIVVFCADDDNEHSGYCEFETSIFSKGQEVNLVENEKFSKYVIKGEKGSFLADLKEGRKIQRLLFDIMIFSGDVTFSLSSDESEASLTLTPGMRKLDEWIQIAVDQLYLSNKILIHIDLAQLSIDKLNIDFSASLNSFFTIQYSVDSFNKEQLEEIIPSGESYLVQINPTSASKGKLVHLQNRFYKNGDPFVANFFALNCEYVVTRGDKIIEFFDGYAQEVLTSGDDGYKSENYDYDIRISEPDMSNYNNKMCMLYVAGYEAERSYDRDIIVGENINQQIIFNKDFKKVRFLFPHADVTKDIAVHFNVVDKAFYKVVVLINNENARELTVTRTNTIYFLGNEMLSYCKENTLCPVVIQVEYDREIVKTDPMIEITVREILNTPSYLQKGQAKLDFVCGDRYYYLYTDIGKNEIGEVTVNFLREFGYIWARVVRKDQTFVDEEANWRGKYRMPSREWEDSLPYNGYTKKLYVDPKETADCIEGCYLLISIQISQIGEYVEDIKFYPFSIITKITPSNRAYTDIPKVVIQVDEFVVGNVEIAENERIYEFYEIWFPHDSDYVEFDFQSSVAGLYVNLGGTRPTTKNADFKLLPSGEDTILLLKKQEILDRAKSKKIKVPTDNSLQDLSLVIGVWTDKTDSIDSELYSLRVHQSDDAKQDSLDIIEINTDQKILCRPVQLPTGEYRCLFMVIYDNYDIESFTPLIAYGASLNHGALTYMYASFIDRNIYDEFSKSELSSKIPTYQTAELNTRQEGVDFIYRKMLEADKYLYINVMTDKPDPIMIVTSMPIYDYITFDLFEYFPNPNTEQLLSTTGEKLRLAFEGDKGISVNFVTLNGNAELSWEGDPKTVFSLRGRGDRISLSSGKKKDVLIVRNMDADTDLLKEMEDPGLLFYISYRLRDTTGTIDYDEITYGKSLEITYKDSDLPVVLYSKIGSAYRDVNIAITFRDNVIDSSGVFEYSPLFVTAQLVKEKTVYDAKKDPELIPSIDRAITGNYDPALRTAQIFLDENLIKDFNVKASDNPSLYIRVEGFGDFKEKTFEKFSIEAQVSGVNDGVIPVEKVYHYGRVRNYAWQQSIYRLRTDKNRPFMRIHLAFNSQNLDYAISDEESSRRNTTFKVEKAQGKVLITIDNRERNKELYYLIIYKRGRTVSELYLNNYAFKYFNGKTEEELIDYKILGSPEITITESKEELKDSIKCTFNKIDLQDGEANITYFFKVVENKTHHYGEEVNTIAVTESPYFTVYERNPKDNNGKITLTAVGYDLSNWVYLNVIAQIQQNNILEYVSYNGKVFVRPNPNKETTPSKETEEESNHTALFVIVVILVVIAVALVVVIVIFQQRNKALLNQVKTVSFQQTNTNTDPMLQNNINPQ